MEKTDPSQQQPVGRPSSGPHGLLDLGLAQRPGPLVSPSGTARCERDSAMVRRPGSGLAALAIPVVRHRTEGNMTEMRPRRVHFAAVGLRMLIGKV
jgi:hypothetical protein